MSKKIVPEATVKILKEQMAKFLDSDDEPKKNTQTASAVASESVPLNGLGSLQRPDHIGKRDCKHVPIVVVTSEHQLSPGDYIAFDDASLKSGALIKVIPSQISGYHGVVDPFIGKEIPPCYPFSMMVNPSFMFGPQHTFSMMLPDSPPGTVYGMEKMYTQSAAADTDYGDDCGENC